MHHTAYLAVYLFFERILPITTSTNHQQLLDIFNTLLSRLINKNTDFHSF